MKREMLLSVIKRSTCGLKSASEEENQKANTALCTKNKLSTNSSICFKRSE
jgi:hypothetical protein